MRRFNLDVRRFNLDVRRFNLDVRRFNLDVRRFFSLDLGYLGGYVTVQFQTWRFNERTAGKFCTCEARRY